MIFTSENFNGNYFQIDIPNYPITPFDQISSLKRPVISYGAEDIDNESIFFPSNVKVEFYSGVSLTDRIYDAGVSLSVYENNQLIFKGYIDLEDVNINSLLNTYKLTFIDLSAGLKKIPYTYLIGYVGNTNIEFITAIINSITLTIGCTAEFIGTENIKAKTDATFLGVPYYANLGDFGTHPAYFFDGTYKTLWDVLRGILNSFGLVGYFGGDNFIVKSRFNSNIIVTDNGNISEKSELSFVGGYDYIEYSIRTGTVGVRAVYVYDHRFNPNNDPLKKITYSCEVPGGSHPQVGAATGFDNLYAYVPEYVAGFGNAYWSNELDGVNIDGGADKSCWQAVADEVNSQISPTRIKLKTDLFNVPAELFDVITVGVTAYKIVSLRRELGSAKRSVVGIGQPPAILY